MTKQLTVEDLAHEIQDRVNAGADGEDISGALEHLIECAGQDGADDLLIDIWDGYKDEACAEDCISEIVAFAVENNGCDDPRT